MSVIEVANLHKRYGDKVAVDDVSFSVDRGEIFGILGPNGAGKSTTVECVTGVRRPDAGLISVLGFDPRQDRAALRRRVGVQLQKCHLPPQLKVSEALRLYASFYPDPVDWRGLLDEFGLAEQRDTNYNHLSGGQQQRLSIALALVGNPEVVVLDELTTGLDPRARRATWDVIKRLSADGVTVVLVTHMMDEAERLCSRIALIDAGRVVATDTPANLVAQVNGEQRLTFRPSGPLDTAVLDALPEVVKVIETPDQVVVIGTGELLAAVNAALVRHGTAATELRLDQATLEDAYVALTGRALAQNGLDS
ncbi:ABC transporter ATP-binding protein [Saccharothrix saharensis]|uniref:ABC transporter ATP-binding protein n=1 Tax=Saccharothrix saharensis TaxID=571190 RepID=UPI0036D103E5